MTIIEFLAVHTVQEEIRQIQNYSFAAFAFDDIDDIVIGIRVILDQDLSYHAHARLLYIQQRQLIELLYDHLHQPLVFLHITGNDIIANHVAAFFIKRIGRTRHLFIRTCRIQHTHQQIAVHDCHHAPLDDPLGNLEARVLFKPRHIDRNDRDLFHSHVF